MAPIYLYYTNMSSQVSLGLVRVILGKGEIQPSFSASASEHPLTSCTRFNATRALNSGVDGRVELSKLSAISPVGAMSPQEHIQ